ncbi:hypothetical protein [Butyrivibrio sp. AE3004]|uniref:hypothetical protein n=1 Tax=Butyrivibrio sp. AE3004 TaxID=1506994 RepID=UPI000493E903|nr:hypothetical protein [Butyrivibrio sp. AE3004]
MKKFIAGTILLFVLLLGAWGSSGSVHASGTEVQTVLTSEGGNAENADGGNDNEYSDVLGEKRAQSDKFILGIEIAISLTFAVGLVAASHGAEVK